MRSILALALVLALAAPALAASPFADVPKTHWAYDAIQKAVDAGILQGFNGKFEGQRLLNRYQMAVIVAKLIENCKANPGTASALGTKPGSNVASLEALTIEFADELALLNVKVSTLEDTFAEMKNEVNSLKGGHGEASAGGLGFTAFAQVGLENTAKGNANAPSGPMLTRYGTDPFNLIPTPGASPDSLFFTLPQASIGVDKEVNPGVFFHAQFDYASDVNDASAGKVGINEAYFMVDEVFGDIGGKVGAFALPFSMEHKGPFRTCNYTITPSFANVINEGWRGYGVQFEKVKDREAGDINWNVGIVSGTDAANAAAGWHALVHGGTAAWTDAPVHINQGEGDDNFGYYLFVGKEPEEKGFGWQAAYFDNGGDQTATAPHAASPEVSYWQVGAEWWTDSFGVMGQYMFGDTKNTTTLKDEFAAWYVLFNYEMDEKNNVSLRFDRFQSDPDIGNLPFGDDLNL